VPEIRVFLVEFVDDHEPRQHEFVRVLPGLFGLDLDAVDAVDDTIAQSATRSAGRACATNAAYPGVSIKLILVSLYSRWAKLLFSETFLSIESSS
jgi:hypothetical protein